MQTCEPGIDGEPKENSGENEAVKAAWERNGELTTKVKLLQTKIETSEQKISTYEGINKEYEKEGQ